MAKDDKSYLVARTRSGKDFNRGGLKFTGEYQAWPLAEIGQSPPADNRWGKGVSQLDAIMNESMLEASLRTEGEVKRMVAVKQLVVDDSVSKAELVQHIIKLQGQLKDQAERIAALEVRLQGDKPPKKTEDLPPGNPANVPPQR